MSGTDPVSAPQELIDFLSQQGENPAVSPLWRLFVRLLRLVRQQQQDIAAIKAKLNLP